MYLINKEENNITEIQKKTFTELNFREREHLQEWIAKNPSSLGEELLIIQKEFNGFNDTKERLDLLALDKQGNLVIIENKLDDSGKDVTWQAIKYASYCSSLTKQDIIKIYQDYLGSSFNSEEEISEFYDQKDIEEIILNQGITSQRIILVAANFRKEVTSSVIWLSNFKIRLQCFKVTPYALGEQLLLNFDQILPIKDTENFIINMASKAQEEIQVQETLKSRHNIRIEFWEQFIAKSNLFANNSPTKENWIAKGIGISGINLEVNISRNNCSTSIYLNKGKGKEFNKELFDFFLNMKKSIEEKFGNELIWQRKNNNVTSIITYKKNGLNYFEKDDWNQINDFLIDSSMRMHQAFKEPMKKMNAYLKMK